MGILMDLKRIFGLVFFMGLTGSGTSAWAQSNKLLGLYQPGFTLPQVCLDSTYIKKLSTNSHTWTYFYFDRLYVASEKKPPIGKYDLSPRQLKAYFFENSYNMREPYEIRTDYAALGEQITQAFDSSDAPDIDLFCLPLFLAYFMHHDTYVLSTEEHQSYQADYAPEITKYHSDFMTREAAFAQGQSILNRLWATLSENPTLKQRLDKVSQSFVARETGLDSLSPPCRETAANLLAFSSPADLSIGTSWYTNTFWDQPALFQFKAGEILFLAERLKTETPDILKDDPNMKENQTCLESLFGYRWVMARLILDESEETLVPQFRYARDPNASLPENER